jgi:hypothetical protein
VTRVPLRATMDRLQSLGTAQWVSDGTPTDHRRRYDTSGLNAALALCIAADPTSAWAQARTLHLLLPLARVPEQVIVGRRTGGLQVQPLARRIAADQHLELSSQ